MNVHFNNGMSDATTVCVGVVLLPSDFIPSDRDVICGRAKKNFYHGTFSFFNKQFGIADNDLSFTFP